MGHLITMTKTHDLKFNKCKFAKKVMSDTINILINATADPILKGIAEKVKHNTRITDEECLQLFEKGELSFVGTLANIIRERLHGDVTYFNRNFHIEPTNVANSAPTLCFMHIKKKDGN